MRASRSVGAGFATMAGVAAVILYPTSAHPVASPAVVGAAGVSAPFAPPPATTPAETPAAPASPSPTAAAPPSPTATNAATPAGPAAAAPRATARPHATTAPPPAPAPAAPPAPAPVSGTFTGGVAQTSRGPVQVRITVTGGRITAATAIQHPTGNSVDTQINAYAIPILDREAVGATSGRIAAVSGATVTSGGYMSSLQSAIDQAFHA